MLLPTKHNEGAWRYHSSGSFASAEAGIYRHETFAATAPSAAHPPPPPHHHHHQHRSPNDYNDDDPMTRIVGDYENDAGGVGDALFVTSSNSSNSSSGNKRPLATSIEELEQGWLRVRCVSKSSNDLAMVDYATNPPTSSGEEGGGGWGISSMSRDSCVINDFMDDDDDDDNVLDDYNASVGNDNDRVNKRRRFASPYATTTMKITPVQRVRIDPMTRPSACSSSTGEGGGMLMDEMTTVNNVNNDCRHDIKAGWYEGQLHENTGLRHGHGITHHDDGTTYKGPYINDNMNGPDGRYTFVIQNKLIPDPIKNYHAGTTEHYLRRTTEVIHTGSFRSNVPHGVGTMTIRIIDYVPTVDTVRSIEFVYDIGIHISTRNEAVGEGVRVVYRSAIDPIEHRAADGQILWEKSWFRLFNGRVTSVRVSEEYAAWIVQCMETVYPGLPVVDDTMMMAMMRPSAVGSRPLY